VIFTHDQPDSEAKHFINPNAALSPRANPEGTAPFSFSGGDR